MTINKCGLATPVLESYSYPINMRTRRDSPEVRGPPSFALKKWHFIRFFSLTGPAWLRALFQGISWQARKIRSAKARQDILTIYLYPFGPLLTCFPQPCYTQPTHTSYLPHLPNFFMEMPFNALLQTGIWGTASIARREDL